MGDKIGILALQGDVREHRRALIELGAHPVEVRRPEDLAGVDGLILPGGESTTISLLIESSGLRPALADRLSAGMPAFGTCAGMILLAREVLDGRPDQVPFGVIDIGVRRNAFGRQVDSFETDLTVVGVSNGGVSYGGVSNGGVSNGDGGPGGPVRAVFIRAPVVERVGPGVDVLASVDGRPVACQEGPVLVTSFHPELSDDLRLHELFLKGC